MQKFEPEAQKNEPGLRGSQGHDDELKSAVYSYVAGGGLVLPFHENCASPGRHRVFSQEERPERGCEG
jgi:hypothetical protein